MEKLLVVVFVLVLCVIVIGVVAPMAQAELAEAMAPLTQALEPVATAVPVQ